LAKYEDACLRHGSGSNGVPKEALPGVLPPLLSPLQTKGTLSGFGKSAIGASESGSRGRSAMAKFGTVRSLQRGLQILEAVNHHSELRASKVARIIGVPRPTAYRLLETLEGMGFVARGSSQDSWRPTLKTKSLSSGFRDEDWVAQTAVPQMMKLGRRILWPLDLVTFRNYRMVIRESTHNISPFSVDHGMVGRELPVLETAGGRAYLAYVSPQEREQILAGLRSELGDQKVDYHEDGPLSYILDSTLALGVGFRIKGFNRRTMSISAPIMGHDGPIGCLTMIWIASAMKFDAAILAHKDALRAVAEAISKDLMRLSAETGSYPGSGELENVEKGGGHQAAPKAALLVAADRARPSSDKPLR
jgi:IclR family mhp operon transcriptional activator